MLSCLISILPYWQMLSTTNDSHILLTDNLQVSTANLRGRKQWPHFMDERTEAQRRDHSLKIHSLKIRTVEPGYGLGQSLLSSHLLSAESCNAWELHLPLKMSVYCLPWLPKDTLTLICSWSFLSENQVLLNNNNLLLLGCLAYRLLALTTVKLYSDFSPSAFFLACNSC